jgi:hypothetical protein
MKIKPIGTGPLIPFKSNKGIYIKTTHSQYGNESVQCDYGDFKGNNIEIYTAKENNTLKNKLYYISDKAKHWLKSKLVYFEKNKKIKAVVSTADKIHWQ